MTTPVEQWLAFIPKLLGAGIEIAKGAKVTPSDWRSDPKVLALLLMTRTMSNLKGIRLLMSHGRLLEARLLVRTCIENSFWVGRLGVEGESFVRQMKADDDKRRTMIGQLLFDARIDLEAKMEEQLRAWMKANKHHARGDNLNPKAVAKGNPLGVTYLAYAQLSGDAHPSFEALERYVDLSGDEYPIIQLEPPFDHDQGETTLQIVVLSTLGALVGVNSIVEGNAASLLNQLTEEMSLIGAGNEQKNNGSQRSLF